MSSFIRNTKSLSSVYTWSEGANRVKNIIKISENGKTVLLNKNNFRFVKVAEETLNNNEEDLFKVLEEKYDFFQKPVKNERKTVYYTITRKCNLNCEFCANNSSPDADTKLDLQSCDIENVVLEKLEALHVRKIVISGGEPLIKKDFKDLMNLFYQKFGAEKLVLQTNGMLITGEIAEFLKGKIAYIEISVENIVESPKLKNKMMKIFDILRSNNIKLVFSFVVTSENRNYIKDAIDLCVNYNAYIEIRFVAPLGRGHINSNNLLMKENEILDTYLEIINYLIANNYFIPEFERILFFKLAAKTSCGAWGNILSMQPNGDLYMCPNLQEAQYYYGNIFDDKIEDLKQNIKNKIEEKEIDSCLNVDRRKLCIGCRIKYFCTGTCAAELKNEDIPEERLCNINLLFFNFMLFYYDKKKGMEYNLKLLKKHIQEYQKREKK